MNLDVRSDAQASIQNGSKSFYLASLFFSRSTQTDCWSLYRWCRACDDRIDEGGTVADLEDLRSKTQIALEEGRGPAEFRALGEVCRRHSIPVQYPVELLAGFAKDVDGVRIRDERELEEYAYQVAGVVGMMMSHIMRADLPRAAEAAKSMGNAMQLTNIARDIREDFERGRIYLPESWLKAEAIERERLLAHDQREALFRVTTRLLRRADELYREGYRGLSHLPFRAAVAVSIAAAVYSSIGKKILREGPGAIDKRVYVSLPEKLLLVAKGIGRVLSQLPERWSRRRLIENDRANA